MDSIKTNHKRRNTSKKQNEVSELVTNSYSEISAKNSERELQHVRIFDINTKSYKTFLLHYLIINSFQSQLKLFPVLINFSFEI